MGLFLALACGADKASAKDTPQPAAPVAKPADAAPAAEPPAPAGTAAFSADAAASYFASTTAADAAAHFAIEQWQEARDGFAAFLTAKDAPTDDAGKARVAFVIAVCDSHLDKWQDAAEGFDRATAGLPALADYSNYEAARAWYFAHDLAKAKDRVAKVAASSLRDQEARLLMGDLLRSQNKWAETAKQYQAYLDAYPDGIRLSEARYRLAEADEHLKKAVPDALLLYRQVTIDDPIGSWNDQAAARVTVLLKQVPKKKRAAYMDLTTDEWIARGKELFDGMRNTEGEAAFRAALTAKGKTDKNECEARYYLGQSVYKERARCKAAPLLEEAAEACAKVGDADHEMRAAYQAGRGYLYCATNEGYQKAIARLVSAEKAHPEHSMADDARVRQAEAWSRLTPQTEETRAKVEELYSTVPTLYPDGDMRAEALWRLAWRDYKAGKYEAAIAWLDKEIATMPHDDNYWAEGQPQYWKARAYEHLGNGTEAVASYEACVRQYPLSYYSLHALNRLREQHADDFKKITAAIKLTPKGWKAGTPVFTFAPRAIYADPGFARALELLRLGMGADAERELTKLGLKVPEGRKKVTDADQAEQLWAVALLYDRAHRYDKSHWIARWSVLDYKDAWPTAANRERWEIAYPLAWWHLIEPAGKTLGYPPELLIAHVREESAFDPLQESFANAIGLTQMIHSTGTRFAKGLGFEATRENLRDPAKNVAVGSRFLQFLWKLFGGDVGLTVPAYNSGEGAVWKFLCSWGDWPLDEFAEEIPYDETRNYSKRVLESYFVYSYMKDGTIPVVSNDIPKSAMNPKRCKAKPADASDNKE